MQIPTHLMPTEHPTAGGVSDARGGLIGDCLWDRWGPAICRRRLRGDRVSDKERVTAEGSAVIGFPRVPQRPTGSPRAPQGAGED